MGKRTVTYTTPSLTNDQFLRVKKERIEYLGDRYFRFNYDSDKAIQVCISLGKDLRRGKSVALGIYTISKMTLFTNYIAMEYLEPVTKREYKKQFNKVVKILQ